MDDDTGQAHVDGGDSLAKIERLRTDFVRDAGEVRSLAELEELRSCYVGRKRGRLTAIFDTMGSLPGEVRGRVGRAANDARQEITRQLGEIKASLNKDVGNEVTPLDVTLPGRSNKAGSLHPITLALQEIADVFTRMGYTVLGGPEVEHDYYNFEALNIPRDHPARDSQDTLYLDSNWLLRTHTSPVQIRTMEEQEPPLAIIVPGRVYRRDTPDATHTPSFVQCEGLLVDRDITMADLRGTLDHFAKALLGPQTQTRLRPGYFPFTEPSAEVLVSWKDGDWLEILGCGMVDPNVFENVGFKKGTQGFAFGVGVERLAMLRHNIDHINNFYDNDLRFLRQF